VRICNLSLLNTDWYIDQMKRQAYDSDPLPIKMDEEKYRQGTRDLVIMDAPRDPSAPYMDLESALSVALDDSKVRDYAGGKKFSYLPSNSFRIPVDSAAIVEHGVLSNEEMPDLLEAIEFTLSGADGNPKSYILKNQFAALDMIHNNNWERPIYFAVTTGPDSYMGLQQYFRLEGLAYRLVPIKYPQASNPNAFGGVSTDRMYTNVMDKWSWGGMDNVEDGIYMDENNRRMVTNFRLQMSILAEALLEEGDPERALDICEELLVKMPNENVPISRVLMTVQGVLMEMSATENTPGRTYFDLPAKRRARAQELAKQLTRDLFDIQADALNYYYSLDVERYKSVAQERRIAKQVAELMQTTVTMYMPGDSLEGELTEELEALEAMIAEAEMRMANLGSFEF